MANTARETKALSRTPVTPRPAHTHTAHTQPRSERASTRVFELDGGTADRRHPGVRPLPVERPGRVALREAAEARQPTSTPTNFEDPSTLAIAKQSSPPSTP
ncbi:hypothetical protein SCWH03_11240 [Streptomyces pacificus]|uniref:Uncharacterized protein n=1 Tax=Streptomyces pacificus TaxID=2705029 RepID=A0A6A0APJ0_9ACTN|nr:hypothetical protein SCWH03_11240 [Streptomyces pacificus]